MGTYGRSSVSLYGECLLFEPLRKTPTLWAPTVDNIYMSSYREHVMWAPSDDSLYKSLKKIALSVSPLGDYPLCEPLLRTTPSLWAPRVSTRCVWATTLPPSSSSGTAPDVSLWYCNYYRRCTCNIILDDANLSLSLYFRTILYIYIFIYTV